MDAEVARLSVAVGAALVVYLLALLRLRGIQRSDKRAGRTHRGPLTSVRANHGAFSRLVPRLIHDNQEVELADNRVGTFRNYFRMNDAQFQSILEAISDDIEKMPTCAVPITPRERLMVTLRYLATGQSLTSLHYEWNISVATLSNLVMEVCESILRNLRSRWLITPQTEAEWTEISLGLDRWNYPNCLGCIDGKHIAMNKPWKAGSQYHNYKGFESVVLLGVCDSNYRFTYVECGAEGRTSDGGVFRNSQLFQKIEDGSIQFPDPIVPPMGTDPLPYVLVGDEAFPLKNYMMRPYSGDRRPEDEETHNQRLSRCRRLIENSFGIMANTWRILLKRIDLQPERVRTVTLTACLLHNLLRDSRDPPTGATLERVNVEEGLGGMEADGARGAMTAMAVRDRFKAYVNTHPVLFE